MTAVLGTLGASAEETLHHWTFLYGECSITTLVIAIHGSLRSNMESSGPSPSATLHSRTSSSGLQIVVPSRGHGLTTRIYDLQHHGGHSFAAPRNLHVLQNSPEGQLVNAVLIIM